MTTSSMIPSTEAATSSGLQAAHIGIQRHTTGRGRANHAAVRCGSAPARQMILQGQARQLDVSRHRQLQGAQATAVARAIRPPAFQQVDQRLQPRLNRRGSLQRTRKPVRYLSAGAPPRIPAARRRRRGSPARPIANNPNTIGTVRRTNFMLTSLRCGARHQGSN